MDAALSLPDDVYSDLLREQSDLPGRADGLWRDGSGARTSVGPFAIDERT